MHTTKRLAELIGTKHRVLTQLRVAGQRQATLIASGDTAALLKVLAAKQQLILALQNVEHELAPYHSDDPEQRRWHSAQERARCAEQAAECNAMLDEILQLEKSGMEELTIRRNEVAAQLEQVHAAAHVRSAYEAQRRAADPRRAAAATNLARGMGE